MASNKISAFFKPAPKGATSAAASAAAPATGAALTQGFELRFSRSSKVIQWDEGLFTDCRPSEADDAMDDTLREAKKYDHSEAEDKGFGSSLNYKKIYKTVDEANAAAKRMVNDVLAHPVGRERAKQEDVANGELPLGYKLPPTDEAAKESIGAGGRGTYCGSLTFFCDPYGADVWNVCTTEYTVRVVVEGDRSAAPSAAASSAAGKAKSSAAKEPPKHPPAATKPVAAKPSGGKVSASRTSLSKARAKTKPRVGIVSVPGMSKKEVAALNKQIRASAASSKRTAAYHDDDSDDDPYYSSRGRSAAFWERELGL